MNVDWSTWQPQERATLCFMVEPQRILLIRKKRGLGAGKINGPGGRLEPGESPLECAIRECHEELHITPIDPVLAGELSFQFTDGYALHCSVFKAGKFTGSPTETEEAVPLWSARDAIPYDQMWADDQHWLPLLLDGTFFCGRFVFDADVMLTKELDQPATQPDAV